MQLAKIRVTGRVQGVTFRHYAKVQAQKLRLQGFAKNESDGSVYIEAEGSKEAIDAFIEWCHTGSPLAHVKSVTPGIHEPVGHQGFIVR